MADHTASKQLLQSLRATQVEWRYETTKQKANRIRFEAIHNGLFNSRPGKAAQPQQDLSTRFPEHYLITSLKKPPPVDPESLLAPLPPALHTLRKLQKKNGSWEPSPKLYAALGGSIPDPPEGVSEWRWATALVVVFLARHPHLHEALNPLYEAAREWSADPHLMRSASEALPPGFSDEPCYFPLNETAMKSRKWQDAAKATLQRVGYRLFVPEQHRYSTLYPGTDDEAKWFDRMADLERTAPFGDAATATSAGGDETGRATTAASKSTAKSDTRRPSQASQASRASRASRALSAPPEDSESEASFRMPVDPDIAAAMQLIREHKEAKAKRSAFQKSKLSRRRRKAHKRHRKAMKFEWAEVSKQQEVPLAMGERVCCCWRRGKRWEQPTRRKQVAPAIVSRVNVDGTADVTYQVAPYERENSVPRGCIFRVGEEGYVDYFGTLHTFRPDEVPGAPKVRASGMLQDEVDAIVGRVRARRSWKPTRSARLKRRWLGEVPAPVPRETTELETWRSRVFARPTFGVRYPKSDADRAFRARPPSAITLRPTAAELQRRKEAMPGYKPPTPELDAVSKTLQHAATAPAGALASSMQEEPVDPMAEATVSPSQSPSPMPPPVSPVTAPEHMVGGIDLRVKKVGKIRPNSRHLPALPHTPEPAPPHKTLRGRFNALPAPGILRRPHSRSLPSADGSFDLLTAGGTMADTTASFVAPSRAESPPPGAAPREPKPRPTSSPHLSLDGTDRQPPPTPQLRGGEGDGQGEAPPSEGGASEGKTTQPDASAGKTTQPNASAGTQPDASAGTQPDASARTTAQPDASDRKASEEHTADRDEESGHEGDVDEVANPSDDDDTSDSDESGSSDTRRRRRRRRQAAKRRTRRMRLRQRRRRRRSRVARYKATGRKLGYDSSSGGYTSTSSSDGRGWTTDEEEEAANKPNYSTMTHQDLINLINERQAISRHRPPSASSDGISSDEEELDLAHDHPANRRQRLEDRIVRALTVHERLVKQVMLDTLAGSVKWRTAVTYKQKQEAFRKTTLGLQQVRRAACRLVECVAEWQRVEASEFGTARKLLTERVKAGEASKPTPPIMGKPWPREDYLPPPFFWHGQDVLIKLIGSLDFLDGVPELQEWYQGLYFKRNPFVLALPLDRRPPTPRKTTRPVRVGTSWVDKEFKSLVQGRKMDIAAHKAYRREARKITAEWWPCHGMNKKVYDRVREAERVLLVAEFAAREAASAILHGSTAIRAKAVPHAMDGLNREGVPLEVVEREEKERQELLAKRKPPGQR